MIKMFKITDKSGTALYMPDLKEVGDYLEGEASDYDLGTAYTIEVVELTPEEVEDMPDFDGF